MSQSVNNNNQTTYFREYLRNVRNVGNTLQGITLIAMTQSRTPIEEFKAFYEADQLNRSHRCSFSKLMLADSDSYLAMRELLWSLSRFYNQLGIKLTDKDYLGWTYRSHYYELDAGTTITNIRFHDLDDLRKNVISKFKKLIACKDFRTACKSTSSLRDIGSFFSLDWILPAINAVIPNQPGTSKLRNATIASSHDAAIALAVYYMHIRIQIILDIVREWASRSGNSNILDTYSSSLIYSPSEFLDREFTDEFESFLLALGRRG